MLRAAAILVAGATLSACGIVRSTYVEQTRKCEGLDSIDVALSTKNLAYFRGWTDREYAKLENRITECDTAVIGKGELTADQRRSLVQEVRDAFDAERQAKIASARQLTSCMRSPEYTRYAAANVIRSTEAEKAKVEDQLARDREVVQVSGVRDLRTERTFGELLVTYTRMLDDAWRNYRAAGGTARVSSELETSSNPCE